MKPLRAGRGYDRDAVSQETGQGPGGPSLAKQEFKEDADINTLVKRFGLNAAFPSGARIPRYGDFTGVGSYLEACLVIAGANESFDALPAEVRKRFQNEPGQFVDFCNDPANAAQLEEWGLVDKPVEPMAPGKVEKALRRTQVSEATPPPTPAPASAPAAPTPAPAGPVPPPAR